MQSIENQRPVGGGYHPVSQDVIAARLAQYCRKKHGKELPQMAPLHRQQCVFALIQHCGYTQSQCADLFKIDASVISRDWSQAQFFFSRFVNFRQEITRIYNYIMYMSRYLNSSSAS